MTRFPDAALIDAITQFHDEMQRIALAAAREIFDREFARTLAELRASEPRRRETPPPGKPSAAATGTRRGARAAAPVPGPSGSSPRGGRPARLGRGRATAQLSLPLAAESAPAAGQPAAPAQPAASAAPSTATPGKRVRWTRESIISELATWMLSGTAIDGAFMSRHGPPGLVSATRRIFGRFEAALNLAGLHIAKLYPDGPPER